jgi:KDO2-lipid IV(A) lauroyltransferase
MAFLLRALLTVLGWLPLPVLHATGWLLGELAWRLPTRQRKLTLRHLERCLPELPTDARLRLARRSLIESGKAVCEAPAIWFGPAWRLRRWIDDEPTRQAIRRVLGGGQGAILLTPHLGCWEITLLFCSQIGRITALYKPQKGAINAVILAGRRRFPNGVPVPTDAGGVKAILGALKRGEMAGVLPDHDPPEGGGSFAPLFGIPAHTMDLIGKLASRTRAPVWFIVGERLRWGRGFRFHLSAAPAGIHDPATAPEALNAGLEACIRARPEQYWWSYRRYRRRLPGQPDLYEGIE